MDSAYLLDAEFSGIEEVQDRCEAREARSLDPRGLGEVQSPSIANAVDEQKQKYRRDRDLNRLEKIDLELCKRVTSQEATTQSTSLSERPCNVNGGRSTSGDEYWEVEDPCSDNDQEAMRAEIRRLSRATKSSVEDTAVSSFLPRYVRHCIHLLPVHHRFG